jgi:hypothetical protein
MTPMDFMARFAALLPLWVSPVALLILRTEHRGKITSAVWNTDTLAGPEGPAPSRGIAERLVRARAGDFHDLYGIPHFADDDGGGGEVVSSLVRRITAVVRVTQAELVREGIAPERIVLAFHHTRRAKDFP